MDRLCMKIGYPEKHTKNNPPHTQQGRQTDLHWVARQAAFSSRRCSRRRCKVALSVPSSRVTKAPALALAGTAGDGASGAGPGSDRDGSTRLRVSSCGR
jgi:hypothetical protein